MTHRHTDTQTERHTDEVTHRQNDTQAEWHTDRMTHIQNNTHTEWNTDRMTHIQNDTQTEWHTDRTTQRNTYTQTCKQEDVSKLVPLGSWRHSGSLGRRPPPGRKLQNYRTRPGTPGDPLQHREISKSFVRNTYQLQTLILNPCSRFSSLLKWHGLWTLKNSPHLLSVPF